MHDDPVMKGGGLGPYAPGEWSDDTQMAVCIARVAATGADVTADEALSQIAKAFVDWRRHVSESGKKYGPVWALWHELRKLHNVGATKTAKLIARKRPRLVPV